MENYERGKVVTAEVSRHDIPIPNLPPGDSWSWIRIGKNSKLKLLIEQGEASFRRSSLVVLSGHGQALPKVMSAAQIIKKKNPQSHQFTKVGYRVTEEYWDPKEEGLDTLKAIREVPELFVAISQTQLAEDGHEQKSLREFFEYAEGPKRSGARKTNSNHGRAKNPHSKPRDRHRNGVDSQEAT